MWYVFLGCRVRWEAEWSILTSRSLKLSELAPPPPPPLWLERLSAPPSFSQRPSRELHEAKSGPTELKHPQRTPIQLIFRIQNSIFFYYIVIKRDLSEEKLTGTLNHFGRLIRKTKIVIIKLLELLDDSDWIENKTDQEKNIPTRRRN